MVGNKEPRVIFEDGQVSVIDKPSGMLSPVVGAHRLDRDTSGVMVLVKTPKADEALKKQFLERKVNKVYLALVHGRMEEKEGVISAPVVRHPKVYGKFRVGDELSRMAVTEWRLIRNLAFSIWHLALLEVRPVTGRTHQIRVHLKHINHPIVSDPLYGGRKQYREDVKWCPRLFLHAKSIEFTHPGTGKRMKFAADLPPELEKAVRELVD